MKKSPVLLGLKYRFTTLLMWICALVKKFSGAFRKVNETRIFTGIQLLEFFAFRYAFMYFFMTKSIDTIGEIWLFNLISRYRVFAV